MPHSETEQEPSRGGLSLEDHNLLNDAFRKDHPQIIQKMRKKYAHDQRALKQIDAYDPDSLYSKKIKEIYDAALRKDEVEAERLKEWFRINGYDDLKI